MKRKKAIPESTRRAVALRYGCEPGESIEVQCHYCPAMGRITWARLFSGRPGAWVHFTLSLDHIMPESAGGSMEPDNFVLACKSCNSSKGERPVEDWLTTRSRLAHVSFTEPVRETMSGKGREGNKEGKGREVVGLSSSSWRLVTYRARPADAMMPLRARWSA